MTDTKKSVYVVPTLNESSAQNEDIVQLLIFAASRLEQQLAANPERRLAVTILSVEHDTSGWKHLKSLFSDDALKHISVEELQESATPNLAVPEHKAAYNFFEFFCIIIQIVI